MNEVYDKAKKCLDQLLANDQIPFYGYVEIMLQLDVMKREGSFIQVFMKDLTEEEKQHFFNVWTDASLKVIEDRPQGEWIRKVDDVGFVSHICSECGAEIEVEDCSDDKFCFNCGADMRKGVMKNE